MTMRSPGRHRRPARISGAVVTRSTRIGVVAAASGGLLAAGAPALADPAQDAPAADRPATSSLESADALPTADLLATTLPAIEIPEVPAVAVAASSNSVSVNSYGELGFSGYTPEPEPEPEPEVVEEEPVVEAEAAAAPAQEAPVQEAPVQEAPVEEAPVQEEAESAPAEAAEPEPAQVEVATTSATTSSVESREPEPEPEPEVEPEPVQEAPAPSGGIVGIAAQYTGIYYVHGGTTPAGFDCSGYTSFVYQQAGISLPRTAAAQQAAATPVSNPQPGDLVFWGYPAYHVGIYAGDGMVYDSGRPGIPTQKRAIFSGVSGYGRVG